MTPRKLLLLTTAVAALAVMAIPVTGNARSTGPVQPKPGRWGDATSFETPLGFKVRDGKVVDFRAIVMMNCHNTDTGQDYNIAFDTTHGAAPPTRIRRAGSHREAVINFNATDNGRSGPVRVGIIFRGRKRASALVNTTPRGGVEECTGDQAWEPKTP